MKKQEDNTDAGNVSRMFFLWRAGAAAVLIIFSLHMPSVRFLGRTRDFGLAVLLFMDLFFLLKTAAGGQKEQPIVKRMYILASGLFVTAAYIIYCKLTQNTTFLRKDIYDSIAAGTSCVLLYGLLNRGGFQ